jgi:hypothetical protein
MDHGLYFDFNRAAEKLHKYEPLWAALVEAIPGWQVNTVVVCNFVIGVKGSVLVAWWAWHLSGVGMTAQEQRRLISTAMRLTAEAQSKTHPSQVL